MIVVVKLPEFGRARPDGLELAVRGAVVPYGLLAEDVVIATMAPGPAEVVVGSPRDGVDIAAVKKAALEGARGYVDRMADRRRTA